MVQKEKVEMCISMAPADFRGTKIMVYEPDPGYMGTIHVMLYQNNATNLHRGPNSMMLPNAMLLHIDTAEAMNQLNFIPTTDFSHVLDDMVSALQPRTRGGGMMLGGAMTKSVAVFDVGIYTVVLAQDARDIAGALHRVPVEKRPTINRELFDFYGQTFPGHSVALCCFNSSAPSEPMMFWWRPRNPAVFKMPALDEHTGKVPTIGAPVDVDHWLIAGSYRMTRGNDVKYRDERNIPAHVRKLLPNQVIGMHVGGKQPNGDFGIPTELVQNAIYELPAGYVMRMRPGR